MAVRIVARTYVWRVRTPSACAVFNFYLLSSRWSILLFLPGGGINHKHGSVSVQRRRERVGVRLRGSRKHTHSHAQPRSTSTQREDIMGPIIQCAQCRSVAHLLASSRCADKHTRNGFVRFDEMCVHYIFKITTVCASLAPPPLSSCWFSFRRTSADSQNATIIRCAFTRAAKCTFPGAAGGKLLVLLGNCTLKMEDNPAICYRLQYIIASKTFRNN